MHKVVDGLQFPEGPLPLPDGSVLVVEVGRGAVSRVTPDGRIEVVGDCGGGPNGLALGPDGFVWICNNGGLEIHKTDGRWHAGLNWTKDYVGASIQKLNLATGEVTKVYTHYEGIPLVRPNDIVTDKAGNLWFTDIGMNHDTHRDRGGIYYAHSDGSKIVRWRNTVPTPNGIGLSPDEKTLYVADSSTARLWAFDVPEPGVLKDPEMAYAPGRLVHNLPGVQVLDSLAVEASGKICVATVVSGGITIFDPDGSTEFVPVPDPITTNIAFGGPDMRDAWITASSTGTLYRCRWPRPGLKLNFTP